MQKSRFGGSVIDGKISLEGKLGRLWALSWHIRRQVGAKMAKLTLLGGLRGAKLDLKGALEAPQETPKWPKRTTRDIGGVAGGVLFCGRVPPVNSTVQYSNRIV